MALEIQYPEQTTYFICREDDTFTITAYGIVETNQCMITGQPIMDQYLDEAAAPAAKFDAAYNQALESIGSGISDDLEFAGRLKQLETVTGTDIAEAKSGKLNEIMEGVRLGYEDLSNQKNTLYNEIKGGEIDPDALFLRDVYFVKSDNHGQTKIHHLSHQV